MAEPLVSMVHVKKYFPLGGRQRTGKQQWLKAVDDVQLDIYPGETVGLVGESGCGKSTTGRMTVGLLEPTAGEIRFMGKRLERSRAARKEAGRHLQMIFQDPYSSLNPRMTVFDIVAEPLVLHRQGTKKEQEMRVHELLETVGLSAHHGSRFPDEFSGGQRQRIGIARALALNPKLIVCDEPVSALDVSIQAQILNLLKDLQQESGLSYLFIAHGIQAVRYISHRIAVMYLGKIVELAPRDQLFENPLHPYTRALLSAVPVPDPKQRERERILLRGDIPSPSNPPQGCPFHTRCPEAIERCKRESPPFVSVSEGHQTACFLYQ